MNRLVEQTLSELDVDSLRNVRTDLDTVRQVKVLAIPLAKHGVMRGLRRADELERALSEVGEKPWR